MKTFLHRVFLLAIGLVIGYALAYHPEVQPSNRLTAVDCYDSQGKPTTDSFFAKFGGVQTGCKAGETAKLHQTSAH